MPKFWQDPYDNKPNRWWCEDCNAATIRVEEPDGCPNCLANEITEPKFADRWRLTGRAVKMGDRYRYYRGRHLTHYQETYLGVDYSRPTNSNGNKSVLELVRYEAEEGCLRGESITRLTPEQCNELAVMFWKLGQGLTLENLKEKKE